MVMLKVGMKVQAKGNLTVENTKNKDLLELRLKELAHERHCDVEDLTPSEIEMIKNELENDS